MRATPCCKLSSSTGSVCDTLPGVAAQAVIITDTSSTDMCLTAYFTMVALQILRSFNSTFADKTRQQHLPPQRQTKRPATFRLQLPKLRSPSAERRRRCAQNASAARHFPASAPRAAFHRTETCNLTADARADRKTPRP